MRDSLFGEFCDMYADEQDIENALKANASIKEGVAGQLEVKCNTVRPEHVTEIPLRSESK